MKGNYPTEALLEKYELKSEYGDVVQAVVAGDLGALEAAITKNQDLYVQSGVFIIIEKLRMTTLRNFVRRISIAVKSDPDLHPTGKPGQINLNYIYRPLQKDWDNELDLDELEFIIANLIANNMIKGYISHENRMLVLGAEAFPEVK